MRPKYLPKKIIRVDDGAEFLLNELDQRYYLWLPELETTSYGDYGYSYERLMEDPRDEGCFKIATRSDDPMAMRRTWREKMDKITSENRGCGD